MKKKKNNLTVLIAKQTHNDHKYQFAQNENNVPVAEVDAGQISPYELARSMSMASNVSYIWYRGPATSFTQETSHECAFRRRSAPNETAALTNLSSLTVKIPSSSPRPVLAVRTTLWCCASPS